MLQPSSSSLPPSDCSQICGEHSKIGDWISDYDDDDDDYHIIISYHDYHIIIGVMITALRYAGTLNTSPKIGPLDALEILCNTL